MWLPVAVGIARHHEVVAASLRLVDRTGEDGGVFRVGHVPRHVGEVAIRL
jgi:hypothetical protein